MIHAYAHRRRISPAIALTIVLTSSAIWIAPLSSTMLPPCPDSPNCVSSQAATVAQQVAPFAFHDAPTLAHARLLRVLARTPRATVVGQTPSSIATEFRSRVFGFVDDVHFEFDGAARVIHVRSASRTGHSDFGVNRRRVESLRTLFAAER
ncbi:MAG: DUF1499 domain-containing protein [Proteobacteria bacterium]|nr:DUF1499 domain-containing protein [Burkholderiales bacterium]